MGLKLRMTFLLLTAISALPSAIFAEEEMKEFMSPRVIALGTALRGGIGLNESIYLNPAAISFTEAYSIEMAFLGVPDSGSHRLLNLSVVDTKSSGLGGGLGYFMDIPPFKTRKEATHNLNLALSHMIFPKISVGLGAKYRSGLKEGAKWYDKTNGDVGLLAEIMPQLHLGGTLYNILSRRGQERSAGIGARVSLHPSVYLSGDLVKQFTAAAMEGVSAHGGLEVLAAGGVSLRGGYSYEVTGAKQKLSFGGGWGGGKFSLFYASGIDLQGKLPMEHSLAARVIF